ncbi:signal peptidase I [Cyphellophora europaea CBS 101466]|uniref:Signal peptidase I n=1 Tax=Cyphellophora europaea (strain CBS 101466) TaxID=1220924 RepID=W2S6N7_CYPE1|nr:signal peptidase I [Cyphellophora europaea CBS 101466]ETN43703.1 signal peptidase I [Cyphellophora europaea CBS 101466]
MPPICRRCQLWQQSLRSLKTARRRYATQSFRTRNRHDPQPKTPPEASRPTSRILHAIRTSFLLAPFRRLLQRVPGPNRRFIGTTLKLTPIFVLLALHFPYQRMPVSGSSMAPFLNPNNAPHLPETKDMILVKRLGSYDLWGYWLQRLSLRAMGQTTQQPLRRGDIVVFDTPHDPNKVAVKRVVGLAGDKVKTLKGFDGGDEVVVQHNHLWVEGDADDREKSRDSNWYGQISQNLVIGRVVAVFDSWWSPRWIKLEEHHWPAREQGRVTENAVLEEQEDPNKRGWRQGWVDGSAEQILKQMKTQEKRLINDLVLSTGQRKATAQYYVEALKERTRNDPETKALTEQMIERLDSVFTKAGLLVVVDEQNNAGLVPTKEGEEMAREYLRKKPAEDVYSPEEILQRRREYTEARLKMEAEKLNNYEEWAWINKYTPKTVLQNKLNRRKTQFEKEQRELELEQARQQAAERESERLQAAHLALSHPQK